MKTINFDNLTDSPKGLFAKLKIITQPQSSREFELILHIKHLHDCLEIIMHDLTIAEQEVLKGAIDRGVKLIERS